jgi:hypothetical protein
MLEFVAFVLNMMELSSFFEVLLLEFFVLSLSLVGGEGKVGLVEICLERRIIGE